ncbi:MAG TPA: alpha/beta hydrolase [Devosia sp.]|jgi:pimeloyl-ACP methyl ester carboxylesterase|uniref:alpha/beta fold hydrolase n=1 Tax=Devosia sp. TaxID=1871048 RepID=UPI002DDD4A36|nr:alpha/beta hydrolase [Devosia sp.]HEV2517704.1 alpha/beta hydrolase [Devosia sp.]
MMLTDHLRQIETRTLSVGYSDLGPADGPAVLLLHGWPYDIHTYAEVAPLLAVHGFRVIVPYQRGFGTTRIRDDKAPRNAQQAMLALDVIALMDALGIAKATLAGCDWGARAAGCVAALWPERCSALVPVSGYLISSQAAGALPLPPSEELAWWYQYYLATERGRLGYQAYRKEFARLIWRTASPRWHFDEATFDRTALSFDNADHPAIVIHNYRWRIGSAAGDPQLDDLEKGLATRPLISVPTISLEGDANGAPHPRPDAYADRFVGRYEHRTITDGVGHNLPQEAPAAFSTAVAEAASWS